ncbi:MAG: restriction endonuclease, partial [Spirochaetaceae bacterium]|nr:restriction endonuclease [Spirochaetaceae bacterium]
MSLSVLIPILGVGVVILVFVSVAFLHGSSSRPKRRRDSQSIIRAANRTLAQNPKDVDALTAIGDVYFADQIWE